MLERQFEGVRHMSCTTKPRRAGLARLRVVEVHTVVANLGIRHRDNLTRIRRVGNNLKIALERRVEANLARNFACGTACPTVESGSVLQ